LWTHLIYEIFFPGKNSKIFPKKNFQKFSPKKNFKVLNYNYSLKNLGNSGFLGVPLYEEIIMKYLRL
jgi:hypothetical protein